MEDFFHIGKMGESNILILSVISSQFELDIVTSFVVINRFNLYFESWRRGAGAGVGWK